MQNCSQFPQGNCQRKKCRTDGIKKAKAEIIKNNGFGSAGRKKPSCPMVFHLKIGIDYRPQKIPFPRATMDSVQGAIQMLNTDQRAAFDCIRDAILRTSDQRCFFIEGDGGAGKTYLYNTLIRWCINGKPNDAPGYVMAAASTGIAALLLVRGETVHRQFSVPVQFEAYNSPIVEMKANKIQQLQRADLIIIDEVSMLNKKVLTYIDQLLREKCQIDKPFGGKVIILSGDWKQLAPVVQRSNKQVQVAESIKMDRLFTDNFVKLSLKINMRTEPSEQRLREWLNVIGNGIPELGTPSGKLRVPHQLLLSSKEQMIDFCFPPQLFDQPMQNAQLIAENALLCPRNVDVDHINMVAMERMHGDMQVHVSKYYMGNGSALIDTTQLEKRTPSGFPPHILKLKVGAPIMLLRNLNVSIGLCNGTRMQIMGMTEDTLNCRILNGPHSSGIYANCRIGKEEFWGRHNRTVGYCRKQFPVRPCFAMTVNKAQGQTLKKMGLILSGKQCFSHGQMYVAMSRVTSLNGIRIFSPHTFIGNENFIDNIVYNELLK